MRKELLVTVDSKRADWPRIVANAVNYLLGAISDLGDAVDVLTANDATQSTDIAALDTRVDALEAAGARQHPFEDLSSAPGSPTEGRTYYDTTLHKSRTWDGTAWQNHW